MKKFIFIYGFIVFVELVLPMRVEAFIRHETQHDKEKRYQWLSMEFAQWKFQPKLYYNFLHPNYSGKGKESKSNVKKMIYERTGQLAEQVIRQGDAEKERAAIDSIYKMDLENALDRQIDLVYSDYKEKFENLQNNISTLLKYVLSVSNGEWADAVNRLQDENSVICESVSYIHKTGIGYELENVKRDQSYQEALDKMKGIYSAAYKLAYLASLNFKTQ